MHAENMRVFCNVGRPDKCTVVGILEMRSLRLKYNTILWILVKKKSYGILTSPWDREKYVFHFSMKNARLWFYTDKTDP